MVGAIGNNFGGLMKISSSGLNDERIIHMKGRPINTAPMVSTTCSGIRVHRNRYRPA